MLLHWPVLNVAGQGVRGVSQAGVCEVNIYVGNLSYEVAEEDLRQAFSAFGEVASATVIKDKVTGRSRGFGFVEMPAQAEAQAALEGLNGTELKGRAISVNEARPRPEGGRGGESRRGPGGPGGPRRPRSGPRW